MNYSLKLYSITLNVCSVPSTSRDDFRVSILSIIKRGVASLTFPQLGCGQIESRIAIASVPSKPKYGTWADDVRSIQEQSFPRTKTD